MKITQRISTHLIGSTISVVGHVCPLVLVLCLLSFCLSAQKTWTGLQGTNWNDPANWSPIGAPGLTHNVVIPNTTNDPVISDYATAQTLAVESGGRLYNNGALHVYGVNGSPAIDNAGQIENYGDLTVGSNLTQPSIGLDNLAGGIMINDGGRIYFQDAYDTAVIRNAGTFTNTGEAKLIIDPTTLAGLAIEGISGSFLNASCASIFIADGGIDADAPHDFTNQSVILQLSNDNSYISLNQGQYYYAGSGFVSMTLIANPAVTTNKYGDAYWTGCENTGWNNATNWVYETAQAGDQVIILPGFNEARITTAVSLDYMQIDSGAAMTIQPNGQLEVAGGRPEDIFLCYGTLTNKGMLDIANSTSNSQGLRLQKGAVCVNQGGVMRLGNIGTNAIIVYEGSTLMNTQGGELHIGTAIGPIGFIGVMIGSASTDGTLINDNSTIHIDSTMTNTTLAEGSAIFTQFESSVINQNNARIFVGNAGGSASSGIYLNFEDNNFENRDCSIITTNQAIKRHGSSVIDNSGVLVIDTDSTSHINYNTGHVMKLGSGAITIDSGTAAVSITINADTYWHGCIDDDWNTDGNWSHKIPDQSDLVHVAYPLTNPVVKLQNTAYARRLFIREDAGLVVEDSANLVLENSDAQLPYALRNNGTMLIEGSLEIGQLSDSDYTSGLQNLGEMTCDDGEIFIDNCNRGMENDGTFNHQNHAILGIGVTHGVGQIGLLAGTNSQLTNDSSSILIDNINPNIIWSHGTGIMASGANSDLINTNTGYIEIGANINGYQDFWGIRVIGQATVQNTCGRIVTERRFHTGINSFFHNDGIIIDLSSDTSTITSNQGIIHDLNGGTFNITADSGVVTTLLQPVWSGCASDMWSDTSNWSTGAIPDATEDVWLTHFNTPPVIYGSTLAVARSVLIDTASTLSLLPGATLQVNGSLAEGILNKGTVSNQGTVHVGNVSAMAGIGLQNDGLIENFPTGVISVDNTGTMAMTNTGTLNNSGQLEIGQNTIIPAAGIINTGSVSNAGISAILRIDNTTSEAIVNNFGGTFSNNATLEIGQSAPISFVGVYNEAVFVNDTSGFIRIDNTGNDAVFNADWDPPLVGDFTNAGTMHLGRNAPITGNGIHNHGNFVNADSGSIDISNCTNHGISNLQGDFDNFGNLTFGSHGNISLNGINNQGGLSHFEHAMGASIVCKNTLQNGIYINAGVFESDSSTLAIDQTGNNHSGIQLVSGGRFNHLNQSVTDLGQGTGSLGRNGIRNTGTNSWVTNDNSTIRIDNAGQHGLVSMNGAIFENLNSSSLEIGLVAGNIAVHGIKTGGAASFFYNTDSRLAVSNATEAGMQIVNQGQVYNSNSGEMVFGEEGACGTFAIENQAVGQLFNQDCSVIAVHSDNVISDLGTIENNGSILEAASGNSNVAVNNGHILNMNGGTITVGSGAAAENTTLVFRDKMWIGCAGDDWSNNENWYPHGAPSGADWVVISGAGDSTYIQNSATAAVRSIEVAEEGRLYIGSGSSLEIDESPVVGLANLGEVINYGQLVVGDSIGASGVGIYNLGILINHAIMGITNAGAEGLLNTGSMLNTGLLAVGWVENSSIGTDAIASVGGGSQIVNDGGTIQIERPGNEAIRLENGTLINQNAGIVWIGLYSAFTGAPLVTNAMSLTDADFISDSGEIRLAVDGMAPAVVIDNTSSLQIQGGLVEVVVW